MSELKSKGTRAFAWDFLGKLAKNGLSIIVMIFLARLLEPSDFGMVAMVMVVVGMAGIFTEMGLGGALIQRRRTLDIHYSSVFYFNIFIALFLTLIIYLSAPHIANFYNNNDLVPLVQVLSLSFLLNAISSIQRVRLRKVLNYKLLTQTELQSSVLSAILAVSSAFYGLGVWSLAILTLSKALFFSTIIWYKSSWKPNFSFSIKALMQLWAYGFRMFLSSLIDAIFTRLDYLIIGKLFDATALGFFQRAKSLNLLVTKYSSQSLMSVLFPVLSSIQNDLPRFQNVVLKGLSILSFVVFLLLGSLYLVSYELILILFGSKWEPSVDIFQILALSGFSLPLSALLVNILSSRGNSKAFLRLEILKKLILSVNFLVLYYYGVTVFLYGLIVCSFLGVSLNILFASREISLSFFDFAKPILIQIFIVIISVITVKGIFNFLEFDLYLIVSLIIKLSIFVVMYFLINILFKTKSFENLKIEIFPMVLKKLKRGKK